MNQFAAVAREILWPNRERHAIPPLDGPLRPNTLLDEAILVVPNVQDPRALCEGAGGEIYFAAYDEVRAFKPGGEVRLVGTFGRPVSCLQWDDDAGSLMVGVAGEGITAIGGRRDGQRWTAAAHVPIRDPTGIAFIDGAVYATEGSTMGEPRDWRRDLLQKGSSGRLIQLRDDGSAQVVQSALAYPSGVCSWRERGAGLISESWAHAVRSFSSSGGQLSVVFQNSPGYPGHLSRARSGGFWVAFFALRTHLVEFILQEDGYRREMMQTVPEEFWVAPTLNAGESMLAPLQFGRIKTMGATKPWAPPRSYGLVVEYDARGMPVRSFHSRTDSSMHGITSVCETNAGVFATCHSASAVIKLPEA